MKQDQKVLTWNEIDPYLTHIGTDRTSGRQRASAEPIGCSRSAPTTPSCPSGAMTNSWRIATTSTTDLTDLFADRLEDANRRLRRAQARSSVEGSGLRETGRADR